MGAPTFFLYKCIVISYNRSREMVKNIMGKGEKNVLGRGDFHGSYNEEDIVGDLEKDFAGEVLRQK